MVALGGAAGVALDGGLRWGAADAGVLVGGVAHARVRRAWRTRRPGWPAARGSASRRGGTCRRCLARPMVRPRRLARSMSVKSPSGLRQSVSLSASLASSSGRCSAAQAGQLGLGFGAGLEVDEVGKPMPKRRGSPRHAPAPSSPLRCAGSGGLQHRLQRFTVKRPPLARDRRPHECAVTLRRG